MAERQKAPSERSPADRIAAIEERQAKLLSELDRLNERVMESLSVFAPERPAAG